MSDPKPLTDAERNAVARRLVDEAKEIAPAVDKPVAIFTAGQPGAGKRSIVNSISVQFEGMGTPPIAIDPDTVRPTLPYMRERIGRGELTTPDVAYSDAGSIAAKMMQYAAEDRRNIVYDGTLSNTFYARQNVDTLKSMNYRVEIHGMAVAPDLSHASTYDRRELEIERHPKGYGRGVGDDFHEQSVSGLVKTIDALQADGKVDAIVLYNRKGDVVGSTKLEDGRWVPDEKMAEVLRKAHDHPDKQSLKDAAATWERASEMMRDRGADPAEQRKVDGFKDAAKARIEPDAAKPIAPDPATAYLTKTPEQRLVDPTLRNAELTAQPARVLAQERFPNDPTKLDAAYAKVDQLIATKLRDGHTFRDPTISPARVTQDPAPSPKPKM